MEVYVDDEAKLTLHGLQQHYVKLKDAEKNRKLFELLDALEFNQESSILSCFMAIETICNTLQDTFYDRFWCLISLKNVL